MVIRSLCTMLVTTALICPAASVFAQSREPVLLVPDRVPSAPQNAPNALRPDEQRANPGLPGPVSTEPPAQDVRPMPPPLSVDESRPVGSPDPYRAATTTGPAAGVPGETLEQKTLRNEAAGVVLEAEATVRRLTTNSGFKTQLQQLIRDARAVMVIPNFYKAGFVLGAAYGNGVLLVRGAGGGFSAPAFYRLTAGSIGFQAGVQNNEVVMAIMTDAGLRAVMEDQFKGGANIGVTFLTVGGGAEAATTTDVGEDIYAFSHSVGLFGGAGFEGTAIEPRPEWNAAAYGAGITLDDILFNQRASSMEAQGLQAALANP